MAVTINGSTGFIGIPSGWSVAEGGTGVTTLTGVVKGNGTSAFSAATPGTDYLAPPSGTDLLKADNGGALAAAVAGTDYVTPDGSETLTNKTLSNPLIDGGYTEDVFTIVDGASVDLDPSDGSIQVWTLGANRTPVTPTNWSEGQSITLMIEDGTDYTITWTSVAVTWKTDGGSAPTLNTTGYTAIALWKVGSVIYGARVGNA